MNIFKAYNYLIESNYLGRLKKIFSRYELFKKSLNVPGDIVECGVFKGTGHIFWLKLLKIFDEHSIKKVIGFDTFENFSKSILDFEKKNAKKFTTEAKFKNNVSINSINKKMVRDLSGNVDLITQKIQSATAGAQGAISGVVTREIQFANKLSQAIKLQ